MSRKKPPGSGVIKTDAYDRVLYETVRDESPIITDLAKKSDAADAILGDAYATFYKQSPEFKEDIQPGVPSKAKSLLENMMGLPEYKHLRNFTRFDDVASALAAAKFGPGLAEAFAMQQKKEDGAPGSGDDFNGDDADIRATLREALQEAGEAAEDWSEFCQSWGSQAGEIQKLPHEKKMELAETLSKTESMKDIAKILGRLKNIVLAAIAQTPVHGTDEVVDVGQGSDIARMLPTEALKYSKLRTLFYKDMLEGSLAVYNLRGIDYVGSGPIIACLDISGSMSGARETWAKAVVLALAFLAEKQKRPFGLITFEGRVVSEQYWPQAKLTLEDKMDIAAISSNGGGTNYYLTLMAAYEMRDREPQLRPADVVFITDGLCDFSPPELEEVLQGKKDRAIRIYGVAIQAPAADRCLGLFSDNLSLVDDLGNLDHARGILSKAAMVVRKPA